MKKLILNLTGLVIIKKNPSFEVTSNQKLILELYKPILRYQSTVYNN
jgi:hypothetical protein